MDSQMSRIHQLYELAVPNYYARIIFGLVGDIRYLILIDSDKISPTCKNSVGWLTTSVYNQLTLHVEFVTMAIFS